MKTEFIKMAQDNHEYYVRNRRAAQYSAKVARQRAERAQAIYNWVSVVAMLVLFVICSAVCGVY